MSNKLLTTLIIGGALLVCTLGGYKIAQYEAHQEITDCYSYGRVTEQQVKYVGDGMNGGPDLGCFVKRNGTWGRM
jgi:hypothetical protein